MLVSAPMRARHVLLSALLAACGTDPDGDGPDGAALPVPDGAAGGADSQPMPDGPPMSMDLDGDGLDDGLEAQLAADYLPYLSVAVDDACRQSGIVYRLRPHPMDATKIFVVHDHLFENDCGALTGHVGDNEAFGVTIDPAMPAPAGILAIKTISHQGTPCQGISSCGTCPGMDACEFGTVGGVLWPVVFSSKDKHGGYVDLTTCQLTCFDQCSLAPTSHSVQMTNAGEPDAHLTENLTSDGFITAANGWTAPELMNFDPWDPATDFGGAGNVAGDLVDPAFETPVCN